MIMTNTAVIAEPKFNIELKSSLALTTIKWGDVVYVDFGNGYGSEQGGIRPAVVLQNNKGNMYSPCTIVAPMTSSEIKNYVPTHITVLPTKDSGLKKTSIIMCEQMRTIDKRRILSKIGHLDSISLADRIEKAIFVAFSKNFA